MGSFGFGQTTSKPTTVPTWNPQQQAMFDALSKVIMKGSSQPVTKYPGQMYVPETEQERGYFDWISKSQPARAAAIGQIASGKLTPEQIASFSPEASNAFYEQSIRAPALREFEDITKPAIAEQFAGPGYWGGARAEAVTKGTEDMATKLAAAKAGLSYSELQARRAAEDAALGRQATYGPAAFATEASIEGSAGQYARQIEQEKMAGELNRWLMEQDYNNPWIQLMFQTLGLNPYAVGTESNSWNIGSGMTYGGGK